MDGTALPPGAGAIGTPSCPPCCKVDGVVGPGTTGNAGAPGVVTVGVSDCVVIVGVPDVYCAIAGVAANSAATR